jgi:hypothetical protein
MSLPVLCLLWACICPRSRISLNACLFLYLLRVLWLMPFWSAAVIRVLSHLAGMEGELRISCAFVCLELLSYGPYGPCGPGLASTANDMAFEMCTALVTCAFFMMPLHCNALSVPAGDRLFCLCCGWPQQQVLWDHAPQECDGGLYASCHVSTSMVDQYQDVGCGICAISRTSTRMTCHISESDLLHACSL